METMTIRKLLNQEFERRAHISGMQMTVDDLFKRDKIIDWIRNLIGETHAKSLQELITDASTERLAHAAATYLLGMAMRDRLDIPFDLLPKLITSGTCEGFHFFWALVCLCHDLGYHFEHKYAKEEDKDTRDQMDSPAERKKLLKIDHDLMDLNEGMLKGMGLTEKNDETRKWILEAVDTIKKYDCYRRQKNHINPKQKPVIDHGIAGALLMYDLLFKEYKDISRIKAAMPKKMDTVGVMDGTVRDSPAELFIASSLIIACTVGRHNMWLSDADTEGFYPGYGLEKLLSTNPNALVRADRQLEQMLFLLDFLDTIDPVKGLYMRVRELAGDSTTWSKDKEDELDQRWTFLMDHVRIRFVGDYTREKPLENCRWGSALTYRKIEVFADHDKYGYFTRYAGGTSGLNGWLKTRAPEHDVLNNQITYYMPAFRRQGNCWPYGITDQEVNALLLYQGCGVPGKYGTFYSPADAYQAFNLLMMPGKMGEQVRIGQEEQRPKSVYIRHWQKTLNVMTDIFTAQCKYASRCDKKMTETLYRSDRKLNLNLMENATGTIAFTSTSRVAFKDEFLKNKIEPQILHITLGDRLPYFDYEGFFAEQYVNSKEREILLPPLLRMADKPVQMDDRPVDGLGNVPQYSLTLSGFDLERAEAGSDTAEEEWINILERTAEAAAKAMEQVTASEKPDISILADTDHDYWKFKDAFRSLTLRCMGNIYKTYFGSK